MAFCLFIAFPIVKKGRGDEREGTIPMKSTLEQQSHLIYKADSQFFITSRHVDPEIAIDTMYEFLLSAAVEASGGWKNEEAMSGPYCFVGSHTFCINSIEKTVKVSIQSVYRRWTSYTPNLVADTLYSEKLLGPMGGHAALQQIMTTPGVQAGLIVKANYPWNYTNHDDNSVVLVYYQKEVGQRGPYRAACVKVLGRALTAVEKLLLQEELGVDESGIQGNGINGCGKCWYANPNDDDVYTFTIPPSVMLKGALDVDYVTIDGAKVKLDTLEGGLKINCKDLINRMMIHYYMSRKWSADLDGYNRGAKN